MTGEAEREQQSLLGKYEDQAPEWANFITADAHGYIKAFELEPKQTDGGLFYSTGRESVLISPGYAPEVLSLRHNAPVKPGREAA